MKIDRARLESLSACPDGIAAFTAAYPDGFDLVGWDPAMQLDVLRGPLRGYLGWAWAVGLLPRWTMRGADLRRVDLRRVDLRGADLSGADLSAADLRGADLRGAEVRGAEVMA